MYRLRVKLFDFDNQGLLFGVSEVNTLDRGNPINYKEDIIANKITNPKDHYDKLFKNAGLIYFILYMDGENYTFINTKKWKIHM